MKGPRDYYKERHPEEFSDSSIEEVLDFDREVIDHALSTITTNNQEQAFERFCLRVCEIRVCANLIPNTGPAGGGDGKVDADTFPVADSAIVSYYEGVGRIATDERWAFAFSAKQRWEQKLQSDIKSILSTKRPYSVIYYVTNQSVPSKTRQETQDKLSDQHGLSVTICDRTWLLDSIIHHNCAQFAIEELKINSARKFNVLAGPRDRRKKQRLDELLTQLADESQDKPSFMAVENALLAAKLARSLEESRSMVESLFQKARRYSAKLGTDAQRIEVEYQLAWTMFWWYEDYDAFLRSYKMFVDSLGSKPSFDNLSKWRNLWQIASVALRETKGNANSRRTKQLLLAVDGYMANQNQGSTAEVNARFLKQELAVHQAMSRGKIPSDIFTSMAEELPATAQHLGFDFEGFVRWIEVVADIIPANPSFESLFDLASEMQGRRNGEISAAKMQLDRAESLIEADFPKEAVTRLSRAHAHLLKHETRSECIYCLFLLGSLYLRLGLIWAARATFIAASAVGLQYLNSDNELHPGLRICLAQLRTCAIALGLLGETLTWHDLTRILQYITYQRTGVDRTIPEHETAFEILLGRLILRIPRDSRSGLESLPAVLDEIDLPIVADLARIKLGADPSLLDYMPNPSSGSSLEDIYNIQADLQLLDVPVDVPSEPRSLSTSLFGCKFTFEFENSSASRHLTEVLLALIEPIFATFTVGDVFAFQEQVVVRLDCNDNLDIEMKLAQLDSDPHTDFVLTHGSGVETVLRNDPSALSKKLMECALLIGFGSFLSKTVIKDLETGGNASLFDHAYNVSRCINDMQFVVGNIDDMKLTERLRKCKDSFAISAEKWEPPLTRPQDKMNKLTGNESHSNVEFIKPLASLSHSELIVVSPIRAAMWDAAGWIGVLFVWSPYEQTPPLMAFGFDNIKAGQAIIEGWRQTYGEKVAEVVRISIIRGISSKNPYHYRVVVSGQLPTESSEDRRLIQSVARVHTMEATTPKNLQSFLDMYYYHGRYVLSCAGRNADSPEASAEILSHGLSMKELIVREAWEIGRHDPDIAGIQEYDDVIIPEGTQNPPVLELLAWIRDLKSR